MTASFSASVSIGGSASSRGAGASQLDKHIEYVQSAHYFLSIPGQEVLFAGFMECSGMQSSTEMMEVKEGGQNSYIYRLPVRTTFSNITLKRGFTSTLELWNWYLDTVKSKPSRKDVHLILYSLDTPGTEMQRWLLKGAYPVKWVGPSFNTKSAESAVESIELAYEYFKPVQ